MSKLGDFYGGKEWEKFKQTGSVADYLNYKSAQNQSEEGYYHGIGKSDFSDFGNRFEGNEGR